MICNGAEGARTTVRKTLREGLSGSVHSSHRPAEREQHTGTFDISCSDASAACESRSLRTAARSSWKVLESHGSSAPCAPPRRRSESQAGLLSKLTALLACSRAIVMLSPRLFEPIRFALSSDTGAGSWRVYHAGPGIPLPKVQHVALNNSIYPLQTLTKITAIGYRT